MKLLFHSYFIHYYIDTNIYIFHVFSGLEYYWRLDSDSVILRDINYDVFKLMKTQQYDYGYRHIVPDSYECVYALWYSARNFIKEHNIKTTFFNDWTENDMYYNNFEISSMRLWLSKDYASYIDYIDRTGGIYFYRWGDAPIKSIAVTMFIPQERTYNFSDIGYKHQHVRFN